MEGKTFTKEELDEVLENHFHWLARDCDGWEEMRADLGGANLNIANFYGDRLCEANLSEASLFRACLSGASLHGANLFLSDLTGADLSGADLSETNLRGANLSGANLHGAILTGADLYGACLSGASLQEAILIGAKNVPFIPMACPDTGSFTGWKKGLAECKDSVRLCEVIIELEIPEDARRSSATTNKCRCNKAVVKSIRSLDGSESFDIAFSRYDNNFIYKVGGTVLVDNFDEDRFNECAPGIHFFINRQEAVDY